MVAERDSVGVLERDDDPVGVRVPVLDVLDAVGVGVDVCVREPVGVAVTDAVDVGVRERRVVDDVAVGVADVVALPLCVPVRDGLAVPVALGLGVPVMVAVLDAVGAAVGDGCSRHATTLSISSTDGLLPSPSFATRNTRLKAPLGGSVPTTCVQPDAAKFGTSGTLVLYSTGISTAPDASSTPSACASSLNGGASKDTNCASKDTFVPAGAAMATLIFVYAPAAPAVSIACGDASLGGVSSAVCVSMYVT